MLLANALHHRSDAFGSLVALGAIVRLFWVLRWFRRAVADLRSQGGAWAGFPVLDPLGGLLVSGMIFKNGAEVGIMALKALVGASSD